MINRSLQKHPEATIALLTRNSEKYLNEILLAINSQEYKNFEILVIDSSSTDQTIEIAKKYPCRIEIIKPEDFGHGKTRNYAATLARGNYVVFLTHDSIPRNQYWLSELLKPFNDQRVAGVYGRQIPRENEKLLDKYFQSSLYGDEDIIWETDNWRQGDNLFSDANSAVLKSMLIKYPYSNDIIVSEDYEWAIRMLKKNRIIVYNASASVTHSHSYGIAALFKRNFDVGVSYKKIYGTNSPRGFVGNGLAIVRQEIQDLINSGNTIYIPVAIFRDLIRYIAIQSGKHDQWFTKSIKKKYLSAQQWYWK